LFGCETAVRKGGRFSFLEGLSAATVAPQIAPAVIQAEAVARELKRRGKASSAYAGGRGLKFFLRDYHASANEKRSTGPVA
jgi:hypothetical protein